MHPQLINQKKKNNKNSFFKTTINVRLKVTSHAHTYYYVRYYIKQKKSKSDLKIFFILDFKHFSLKHFFHKKIFFSFEAIKNARREVQRKEKRLIKKVKKKFSQT